MALSDPELERGIIGGCFGEDTSRLALLRSTIAEDHFYDEVNRRLWRSLCRIADAGRALSATEVHADCAEHREPVELGFLAEYYRDDWWAVEKYIPRLIDLAQRRRLVVRGQQLMLAASDHSMSSSEIGATAVSGIQSDLEGVNLHEPETASEIVEAAGGLDQFLASSNGVLTPWPQIDNCIAGWQPGDLALLAARPSMGKTAFALNACFYAALKGTPTVFYSFEMSRDSVLKRLICLQTSIRYQNLIRGDLNPVERRMAVDAMERVDGLPLRIVGASGRTVLAVRSHAERLAHRGRCGMIAVDYIGLIRSIGQSSEKNRTRELGEICRQLKDLATQLHIPALVLAQLNRSTEARNDKRPMMGDLRDSGELEEHADLIALLHRPGYYDRKNPEIQLVAEVIIAKQRNGDTPVIQLEFHRNNGRFIDPEQQETELPDAQLAFDNQTAQTVQ